jgi:uncharacterized metal-binding protein
MMQSTMGRRYQIDYAFGLRYVFSPAYRAKIHNSWGQSTGMRVLYMIGGIVSITVVISALLFLALAILGLVR